MKKLFSSFLLICIFTLLMFGCGQKKPPATIVSIEFDLRFNRQFVAHEKILIPPEPILYQNNVYTIVPIFIEG